MQPDTTLVAELGHLAKHYVRGANIEGWPAPAKFDVIAPHALVDALEESNHSFRYGWQHDAAELFAHLANVTGLGAT